MDVSGAANLDTAERTVLVISGPTCSGKSGLALRLAQKYDAEIISADSRQIFRQIKIGTDRLDSSEWQGVTHHLMGSADLGERFTVFDFVREAQRLMAEIRRRGKKIIICGGTGLYIRALIDGIFEIPDDDMSYRNEMLDIASREGPAYIHGMLAKIDPDEAAVVHPHNLVKVIRALEIYRLTGRPKSQLMRETQPRNKNIKFRQLILLPERNRLYRLIEERVERMIAAGLVDEVRSIWESEYSDDLKRSKIVGYSELIQHFEGEIDFAGALDLIKQNTRRFAKRQYTWFKAVKKARRLYGFGSEMYDQAVAVAESIWGPKLSD